MTVPRQDIGDVLGGLGGDTSGMAWEVSARRSGGNALAGDETVEFFDHQGTSIAKCPWPLPGTRYAGAKQPNQPSPISRDITHRRDNPAGKIESRCRWAETIDIEILSLLAALAASTSRFYL